MAIVDVSISGSRNGEVKQKALDIVKNNIENSGFKYIETPMSNVIEGDLDEILKLVRKIQEEIIAAGYGRTYSIIKIDDRRDKKGTLEQKLNSVNSKL
ncbi:MAG: MTH1187 family thiamine-binding protein [Eubacteriaceae bacterium]